MEGRAKALIVSNGAVLFMIGVLLAWPGTRDSWVASGAEGEAVGSRVGADAIDSVGAARDRERRVCDPSVASADGVGRRGPGAIRPASVSRLQDAFTVDSRQDGVDADPGDGVCATVTGDCTLRAAIQESNAAAGDAQVLLPPGTYALTIAGADEDAAASGDLDVTAELHLLGELGRDATIVASSVPDRVLHVHRGATAIVEGVTVRNGSDVLEGAGVYNEGGHLTLDASEVSANETRPLPFGVGAARQGAGLANRDGTLVVRRSIVRDNVTDGAGGGISTEAANTPEGLARLLVDRSVVSANDAGISGGGIHVGTLGRNAVAVVDSEVSGNQAGSHGGGLWVGGRERTALHMVRSTVADNHAFAGGGLNIVGHNVVSATVHGSALLDNTALRDIGGGARMDAWGCITFTMSHSLVARNVAERGAGLAAVNDERLTIHLTNTTLSTNEALERGGGLSFAHRDEPYPGPATSRADVRHVTLSDNAAPIAPSIDAGPASAGGGEVRLSASIVDGVGSVADCVARPGYEIVSMGANVSGDATCGLEQASDAAGVDPLLGALLDHGGATLTHALLPSSPAIDRAANPGCPRTDQRGARRPVGAGCDAGAFEYGSEAPTAASEPPPVGFPYVPVVPDNGSADGKGPCWWPAPSPTPTLTPAPSPSPTSTPEPLPSFVPTATDDPYPAPTGSRPTITPPASAASCVCRVVHQRVPPQVISDALANPERFYGWRYPLNPSKPPGPDNPLRECLTLRNTALDYHVLWNAPEWRVGCQ